MIMRNSEMRDKATGARQDILISNKSLNLETMHTVFFIIRVNLFRIFYAHPGYIVSIPLMAFCGDIYFWSLHIPVRSINSLSCRCHCKHSCGL